MEKPITISIDLTKIDKSRIIEGSKGGKYINMAIIPTPSSEYNTHMVVQSVSKEERENGTKGEILGGAKRWDEKTTQPAQEQPTPQNEDLPF